MDERVEEFSSARLLKRNWAWPVLGASVVALGAAAIALGADPVLEIVSWFGVWIGAWMASLTLARNAFPLARAVRLRASASTLTVNDDAIPVEDILEARVVPKGAHQNRDTVELTIERRGKVRFALMTSDATRLVDVLNVHAGERRASFKLMVPFSHRFFLALGMLGVPWATYLIASAGANGAVALLFTLPFLVVPACLALAAVLGPIFRGRLVVGAEGFTTSWLGHRRHRAFAEVNAIEPVARVGNVVDTYVHLNGDERIRFVTREAPDTHAQRGMEGRALAKTMQEAFDRWSKMPDVEKASMALQRGARSPKEWLAGIDHLVRGGQGNYRVAAVTPDVLVEIARGSDATLDARVGAAAALLRLDAKTHRGTVRIAAEACAEPATRKALLGVVEAVDELAEDALEEALARVR